MTESTGPRTLGSIMAENARNQAGEKPQTGTDPRWSNTPDTLLDLPLPGGPKPAAPTTTPAAPAAKPRSSELYPNTDVKRDLAGDPPPAETPPPGLPSELANMPPPSPEEAAQLAQQYPLAVPDDFEPHEPTLASFRKLAATNGITPAVAQKLLDAHLEQLRRYTDTPDPRVQARRLYDATPDMNP
jgi:hypothetical protein